MFGQPHLAIDTECTSFCHLQYFLRVVSVIVCTQRILPVDDLTQTVLGRNVIPCIGDIGDSSLESEFFDVDPQLGVQITLMAHEVVFIPFGFLSLEPQGRAPPTLSTAKSTKKRSSAQGGAAGSEAEAPSRHDIHGDGEGGPGPAERSVVVAFVSASHGHIVSIMQVRPWSTRWCGVRWACVKGGLMGNFWTCTSCA